MRWDESKPRAQEARDSVQMLGIAIVCTGFVLVALVLVLWLF